jgi:3-hydroxyacyl-[acyl-carrier-protein] dehydratase
MKFQFLDSVEIHESDRVVALKQVTAAEEYLADHFPGFPVFPGVLMVETMAQAARLMLADRGDRRLVLGAVKALRYGGMVRPGEALRVEVSLERVQDDGSYICRGQGIRLRHGDDETAPTDTAVSGRFTMRPVRTEPVR